MASSEPTVISTTQKQAPETHSWAHDVFLSFSGKDQREFLVAILYEALKSHGINAFKDDKNIRKGDNIDKTIVQAIEGSRFSIAVFTKNYARSEYCMMELLEMLRCNHTRRGRKRNRVLSIFYDVRSNEIEGFNESGPYKEAFDYHENNGVKKRLIDKWKNGLKRVLKLAAYSMSSYKDVVELINDIINEIKKDLPADDEPNTPIIWKHPHELLPFQPQFVELSMLPTGHGSLGTKMLFDQINKIHKCPGQDHTYVINKFVEIEQFFKGKNNNNTDRFSNVLANLVAGGGGSINNGYLLEHLPPGSQPDDGNQVQTTTCVITEIEDSKTEKLIKELKGYLRVTRFLLRLFYRKIKNKFRLLYCGLPGMRELRLLQSISKRNKQHNSNAGGFIKLTVAYMMGLMGLAWTLQKMYLRYFHVSFSDFRFIYT